MVFRSFVLLAAVLLTTTACGSKKGSEGDIQVQQNDGMMAGPLDGSQVTDNGMNGEGGAPAGASQELVNIGDRVFFGYDSHDLTPEGQNTLNMQAEWMRKYPNMTVTISGHCDERGTREYNLALGERRAMAAKDYLVALGIPANRINTISYGKERPAVTGSDPNAWAQNRRAVTETQ